jgi:putative drug exporter of the RND superfamily
VAGFERLGAFLYRHRRAVLVGWLVSIALSVAAIALLPAAPLETELGGATGSEAHQVELILKERFGQRLGGNAAVVVDGSADGPALEAALASRFPEIAVVSEVRSERPHRLRLFQVVYDPSLPLPRAQAITKDLRAFLRPYAQARGFSATVTGNAPFQHDAKESSKRDSARGENLSLLISLAILVGLFGALTAAMLPLVVAATTLLHMNALATVLHLPANPIARILGALVGVALAVDYAVFMVSRFREELARGLTPAEAVAVVVAKPGRTVAFSAAIMAISVAALWLPDVTISRAVVRTLLLVLGLSCLNALVLLPALLTVRPDWLDRPRWLSRWVGRVDTQPFWRAFAGHVAGRPRTYFALSVLILGVLAAPVATMRLYEPVHAIAPRDAESRTAYQALEADGWGGELIPVQIVVKAPPGKTVYEPGTVAYVHDLTRALQAHPEVATVRSLTSWNPRLDKAGYVNFFALYQAMPWLGGDRFARLVDAENGSGMTLVLAHPRSLMDLKDTQSLIDHAGAHAAAHPEREALVGGVVARVKDFTRELYRPTVPVVAIVVSGILALLFVYMRSVVLPLKAAVMNFLPILASYGVLTAIFQHGLGAGWLNLPVNGAITNTVPIVLFCVVFGLSMDYEVLILSRISEAYHAGRDVRGAIVEGLATSGGLITGAALILLGVFSMGITSSSPQTQEICLGITAAILIDATIVRCLLVPSFMALMGRWNWWTPWKATPRNDIETFDPLVKPGTTRE